MAKEHIAETAARFANAAKAEKPATPSQISPVQAVRHQTAASDMIIAKVISNETAGGYYTVKPRIVDGTNWNTTNEDHLIDNGDNIVALNLPEEPISGDTGSHELEAGTTMLLMRRLDDDGNWRYVGFALQRYTTECPT